MTDDINILEIDNDIKHSFEQEISNLDYYKTRLKEIDATIATSSSYLSINTLENLKNNRESLSHKINSIEMMTDYNRYIIDTQQIIEKYKEILNTPVKVSFIGKKSSTDTKKKADVVHQYLNSIGKYYNISASSPIISHFSHFPYLSSNRYLNTLNSEDKYEKYDKYDKCEKHETCECGFTEFDIIEDNIKVCLSCGYQKECLIGVPSYKDMRRINVTKYTYDRRVHFKDCINQYQAKQNSTIEQEVYDKLEKEFQDNYILIDSPHRNIKYKNVTKEHISLFLRNLKYTKHYENVNLIHYNLTGIKPDNIAYLEDVLLKDFDELTKAYDAIYKNNIERTNFINTQYVLYQLLKKHKHPCKKEDFVMLKTIERQQFHDTIMKTLFDYLGWNFNAYFY